MTSPSHRDEASLGSHTMATSISLFAARDIFHGIYKELIWLGLHLS